MHLLMQAEFLGLKILSTNKIAAQSIMELKNLKEGGTSSNTCIIDGVYSVVM